MKEREPLFVIKFDTNAIKDFIDTGLYKDNADLLHQAIKLDNVDVVSYILERKLVDLTERNYLFDAIFNGRNRTILERLLEHGADPNTMTFNRILDYSNNSGIDYVEELKMFLKYGLDINKKNLLHKVVNYHQIDYLREMIPYISGATSCGDLSVILSFLVRYCEVADLKLFLDHLKQLNIYVLDQPYQDNDTTLHLAVQYGEIEHVELLLSYGADFQIRNTEGRTPRELAERCGEAEKASLLKSYEEISYVKGAINE